MRSCPPPISSLIFRAAASTSRCCRFCRSIARGNVNVSKLGAKPYLTAGCGGFVDITTHAKRLVFSGFFTAGAKLQVGGGQAVPSSQEGKSRKLVEAVEHVTFSGDMARSRGQHITYVTERCVIESARRWADGPRDCAGCRPAARRLDQAEIPLQVAAGSEDDGCQHCSAMRRFGLKLPEKHHG